MNLVNVLTVDNYCIHKKYTFKILKFVNNLMLVNNDNNGLNSSHLFVIRQKDVKLLNYNNC